MLIILLALLSEIIGTVAGFGSSTIFMPLALWFFDPPTALILTTIYHIFGSLMQIVYFRRSINFKLVSRFIIPSATATLAGALITQYVPTDIFKLIISASLIILTLYALTSHKLKIKPHPKSIFLGATASGLAAGLAGTGGAVRATVLMAFNLPKNIYLGTIASIALISDFVRLPIYISNGFLTDLDLKFIPLLAITSILGAFIGETIVGFIPQKQFRKLVMTTVIAISGTIIYDSFHHLTLLQD